MNTHIQYRTLISSSIYIFQQRNMKVYTIVYGFSAVLASIGWHAESNNHVRYIKNDEKFLIVSKVKEAEAKGNIIVNSDGSPSEWSLILKKECENGEFPVILHDTCLYFFYSTAKERGRYISIWISEGKDDATRINSYMQFKIWIKNGYLFRNRNGVRLCLSLDSDDNCVRWTKYNDDDGPSISKHKISIAVPKRIPPSGLLSTNGKKPSNATWIGLLVCIFIRLLSSLS